MRQNVEDINKLLTGIRDLNAAIRKSEIHGDNALEMRDDRNLMIDELSKYLKLTWCTPWRHRRGPGGGEAHH